MKKIFFAAILCFLATAKTVAQDIYNEIGNKSNAAIENPLTDGMIKHINQFKVDALDYMLIKMREQMPDSTALFLDKQAFAMNNFVNVYIQKILEYRDKPQNVQEKIMQLFMDASFSNPLFNDTDTEITLCYYASGDCITRFSLDTDWRRASAAVAMMMNKEDL